MTTKTTSTPTRTTEPLCPVCGSDTLEEGEYVDVGFGPYSGPKCSPDHCHTCGYIEAGADPHDLPIEHYKRCWEQQIDPHVPGPDMVRGTVPAKYLDYIREEVKEAYGKCRKVSHAMAEQFPELRVVYGFYYDLLWGPREHFWLLTPDNMIVDPTASQFPTGGNGTYEFKYFETREEYLAHRNDNCTA